MPILLQLFLTFLKIGALTFGGGYAMLGIITEACVERKGWITHEQMMHITIIAETTPGPVAINCATFVGYKRAGLAGAICATLGVVLPSFLIIYLISLFLNQFLGITLVANAFRGIKIAVGFLIFQAGMKLFKTVGKTAISRCIFALAMVLVLAVNVFALRLSTVVLMVAAAAVGILVHACGKAGGKA